MIKTITRIHLISFSLGMLSLFRPSLEVVIEGRISEKSDTFKTCCGFIFGWGQFSDRFAGKVMFLYEEGVENIPPYLGSTSEMLMRESQNHLII